MKTPTHPGDAALTEGFKVWESDLRAALQASGATKEVEEAITAAVMGAVAKSWPFEAYAPEVHEAARPAIDALKRAHASLAADLMVACARLMAAGQPLPSFYLAAAMQPDHSCAH